MKADFKDCETVLYKINLRSDNVNVGIIQKVLKKGESLTNVSSIYRDTYSTQTIGFLRNYII